MDASLALQLGFVTPPVRNGDGIPLAVAKAAEPEVLQSLFERIVKLSAMEVPNEQIARACGLSMDRLQQVMASDRFTAHLAQAQTESLEKAETLNLGWDAVEEHALGTVLQTLQANPDPDYALRAAAVANKAQRRNGSLNRPIDGNRNAAATITLNIAFIEKLQSMRLGLHEVSKERKRVDRMIPGMVETLLKDPAQVDLDAIFRRKHEE